MVRARSLVKVIMSRRYKCIRCSKRISLTADQWRDMHERPQCSCKIQEGESSDPEFSQDGPTLTRDYTCISSINAFTSIFLNHFFPYVSFHSLLINEHEFDIGSEPEHWRCTRACIEMIFSDHSDSPSSAEPRSGLPEELGPAVRGEMKWDTISFPAVQTTVLRSSGRVNNDRRTVRPERPITKPEWRTSSNLRENSSHDFSKSLSEFELEVLKIQQTTKEAKKWMRKNLTFEEIQTRLRRKE
jgi:DNA-directed RNA polymerase subunit RPC12/RpoP